MNILMTPSKPGRRVVETSPHNFRVWIHSQNPVALDQKRFVLQKLKSNPWADPQQPLRKIPLSLKTEKENIKTPKLLPHWPNSYVITASFDCFYSNFCLTFSTRPIWYIFAPPLTSDFQSTLQPVKYSFNSVLIPVIFNHVNKVKSLF